MRLEVPVNSEVKLKESRDGNATYILYTNGGGCSDRNPSHVIHARLRLPIGELPEINPREPLFLAHKPDIMGIRLFQKGVQASLGVRFRYKFLGPDVNYVNLEIGEDGLVVRDGGIYEFMAVSGKNLILRADTILAQPNLVLEKTKNGQIVTFSADTIFGRKKLTLQHDEKANIVVFRDNS